MCSNRLLQRVTAFYHFCVNIRTNNDIFACSIPIFPKHDGYVPMKFKISRHSEFQHSKTGKYLGNAAMAAAIDYDPSLFLRVDFQFA